MKEEQYAENVSSAILSLLSVYDRNRNAVPVIITRTIILPVYASKLIHLSFKHYATRLFSLQATLITLQAPIFLLGQTNVIPNFAQLIAVNLSGYSYDVRAAINILRTQYEIEILHTRQHLAKIIIFRSKI